jgi:hypothetical protein
MDALYRCARTFSGKIMRKSLIPATSSSSFYRFTDAWTTGYREMAPLKGGEFRLGTDYLGHGLSGGFS